MTTFDLHGSKGVGSKLKKKEGYELQLVMAMVTVCQWDGAMLALKKSSKIINHMYKISHLSQFT